MAVFAEQSITSLFSMDVTFVCNRRLATLLQTALHE